MKLENKLKCSTPKNNKSAILSITSLVCLRWPSLVPLVALETQKIEIRMRAALALTPLCLTLLMSSLQQMDAAEGHLLTPPFYTTNEANRVTMFDLNSGAFKTIAETDVLVDVEDLCFLDYYTFLVTSKHNVFMYDVSGEMLGVFASGFGQAYGIVKLSTGDIVVSDKENEVLVKVSEVCCLLRSLVTELSKCIQLHVFLFVVFNKALRGCILGYFFHSARVQLLSTPH